LASSYQSAHHPQTHKPDWRLVPVRALIITFVTTLMSFAVCLFAAIIGTALVAKVRGSHPDMTFAYRHVAVPAAIGIATVILISALIMEIKRYRQAKTLAQIERASR
jgi:hypothetical protein